MASPNDESFTERSETLRLLGLNPRLSPELSAAIRKRGGVDRAIRTLFTEFGIKPRIESLADMIWVCNIDPKHVSHGITADHFPVNPDLFDATGCRPFNFGRFLTTSEIAGEMGKEGFRIARAERLLAYAAEHKEHIEHLVALGAAWPLGEGRSYVMHLCDVGGVRCLQVHLDYPTYKWGDKRKMWEYDWSFLGEPIKTA